MKNQKMYEADDKMISIIRDNYNILQSLGSFGINLGFGDKTVREVCDEQKVDTYTFLCRGKLYDKWLQGVRQCRPLVVANPLALSQGIACLLHRFPVAVYP